MRPDPRDSLAEAEKRARSRAGHRVAFMGHAIAYGSTVLLLAFLFFPAAIIVALAWGIGLSLHWFFALAAPRLRDQWIADELERAVPAARAAQRAQSEGEHARRTERLAASLAHEIRNPIAAAKSLVRQIGDDPSASDVSEYARVAEGELDRVEASIAHLLRFSRDEPLRVGRLMLGDVARLAIESVRERAPGTRIDSSVVDIELEADEDKVRRTLVNLVSNAADAVASMPEARRAISVEGGPSADLRTVWVRVRDTGPGIDPSLRDRIFEPWVTGKDSGTGLGLPIARKLCEAHGGTLEVEETSAAGTSMLVTLPSSGPSSSSGSSRSSSSSSGSGSGSSSSSQSSSSSPWSAQSSSSSAQSPSSPSSGPSSSSSSTPSSVRVRGAREARA